MTGSLGMRAVHPDLVDVVNREMVHDGTRHLDVIRFWRAPERFSRVGVIVAGDAFPKADLERVQIGFRGVRHVTVLRIDKEGGYPQSTP